MASLLSRFVLLLTILTPYVVPGYIDSINCGDALGGFSTMSFEGCSGDEPCNLGCTGTLPTRCQGTRELVVVFFPNVLIDGGKTTLQLSTDEYVYETLLDVYTCDHIECPMYNTEKHYRLKINYNFLVQSPRTYTATLTILGHDDKRQICRNFTTVLGDLS